jgi:hypothetical protein
VTGPLTPEPISIDRPRRQSRPWASIEREAAPLEASVQLGQDIEQKRAARILDVAGRTGLPFDLIERNLDTIEQDVAKPRFDAERYRRESPIVSEWMSQDPLNAAVLGRDIPKMGRVERQVRAIETEYERNSITVDLINPAFNLWTGAGTEEDARRVVELQDRQAAIPDFREGMGFVAGIPSAAAGQLPIQFNLYTKAGGTAAVGATVGALAGGAIGAPGGPATAKAGALAGAKTGAMLGANIGVGIEGMRMEGSLAFLEYREMRDENGQPLDADLVRGAAALAGIVAGSLELIPFDRATRLIPGVRALGRQGIRQMLATTSGRAAIQNFAANLGKQVVAEGFTEFAQSMVTHTVGVLLGLGEGAESVPFSQRRDDPLMPTGLPTRLQNITVTDFLNRIGEGIGQSVEEGIVGAQAAVVLGGAPGAIALRNDLRAVKRADANAQRLQSIVDALHGTTSEAGVEAVVDAPGPTEDLVRRIAKDGTEAFYDKAEWTAYWQSQVNPESGVPADPREMALALGVSPQAYDAASVDGVIGVPMETALLKLMGASNHRQWAVDNAKVTPQELSRAEAERAKAGRDEVLADLVETANREADAMAPVEETASALGADFERDLIRAGRSRVDARAEGQLWAAAFRGMSRSGVPVEQLETMFRRVSVMKGNMTAEQRFARVLIEDDIAQEMQAETQAAEVAEQDVDSGTDATPMADVPSGTEQIEAVGDDGGAVGESARTPSGRLVANLQKVSARALFEEWQRLDVANASDQTAPVALENAYGDVWSGVRDFRAVGRAKARRRTQEKIEAELERRGIDPAEAMVADLSEDPTSFDFTELNQSAPADRLVITHNLTADNLLHSVRMGGIPVPSLAVTPADRTLEGFGEITLVGPSEMADPAGRFRTRVFGADIYSPRYPRVEFNVDKVSANRIRNILKDFGSEAEVRYIGDVDDLVNNKAFERYAADKLGVTVEDVRWHDSKRVAEDLLREVEAPERIFQGFTQAGNRRYIPHTLENVVKILKKELRGGENFNYGVGSIRAKFTPQFKSVAQIRKAKERLTTKESFDAIKKEVDEEFFAIAESLGLSLDQTVEVIEDVTRMSVKRSIERAFADYGGTGAVTDAQVRAVGDFALKLKDLPTEYFEAKILREVGVEEFIAALVPSNIKPDVRAALEARGLEVVEYDESAKDGASSRGVALSRLTVDVAGRVLFQGQQSPRGGFFRSPDTVQRIIALFDKADQSTVSHEMFHALRDLFASIAAMPEADPAFRADLDALHAYVDASPTDTLSVEQEERLAVAFEAYLMEGKAPSRALQRAFAHLTKWLTRIYETAQRLFGQAGFEGMQLTDEVRGIFDRLLTTQRELDAAQYAASLDPLFPDDPAVMEASTNARLAAEDALRADVMRSLAREETAWWQERREGVRERVAQEVAEDPAYIAKQALGAGQNPDGTPLAKDDVRRTKLDRDSVVAIIGEDATKDLPRPYLYARKDGMPVELAAPLFGYANGSELLAALQGTIALNDRIESLTTERMVAEFGDQPSGDALTELAFAALYNDAAQQKARLEMQHIVREYPEAFPTRASKQAAKAVPVETLSEWAKETLGGQPIKAIRPATYRREASNAAKSATRHVLKAEWREAVQAKQRELNAMALYAEAVAIRDAMEKSRTEFKKLYRPDERIAKTRDINYVNTARAILANVGFGKKDGAPADWLDRVKEYDPATAKDLTAFVEEVALNVRPRENFRDLTVDEFHTVREAVNTLWARAREDRVQEVAGEKLDRHELRDAMLAKAEALPKVWAGIGRERQATFTDRSKKALLSAGSWLRIVESWVDLMDQGDINGPFRRALFTEVREQTAQMLGSTRTLNERFEAALRKFAEGGKMSRNPIPAPELASGWVWRNEGNLLGALLHIGNRTGNQSNFRKMIDGRGWTDAGWQAMVDRYVAQGVLQPRHFALVQEIWDIFEAMKPEAQRVHKQLLGFYFSEVTREPFSITFPDGTTHEYQGGYTPATADPEVSTTGAERKARNEMEEAYGFSMPMRPTVGKGFTKGRTAVAEPLVLDLGVVKRHIDAVQRFTHLAIPVRAVARQLMDRDFRAMMDAIDPTVVPDMLIPWLKDAATGQAEKPMGTSAGAKAASWMFRVARTSTSIGFLMGNVPNVLEQHTGLSIAALKVKAKYLASAHARYISDPRGLTEAIRAKDPFMASRTSTRLFEVAKSIDTLTVNPNAFQTSQAWLEEHALILQQMWQSMVDTIVWAGAYDQAIAEGLTEAEAVRSGGAAVRLTQGSFEAVDLSRAMKGNAAWRFFTTFAGWFNMVANTNATELVRVSREMGFTSKAGAGRAFYVYLMGYFNLMIISGLIRQLFVKGRDIGDDDDDAGLMDWMAWVMGEQFRAATPMVPVAGTLVQTLANQFDSKFYNDNLEFPATSVLNAALRGTRSTWDAVFSEDELKRRDVTDMLTLLQLLSRFPVRPLAKPINYLRDVESGEAEPTGPIDFTRGVLSGVR